MRKVRALPLLLLLSCGETMPETEPEAGEEPSGFVFTTVEAEQGSDTPPAEQTLVIREADIHPTARTGSVNDVASPYSMSEMGSELSNRLTELGSTLNPANVGDNPGYVIQAIDLDGDGIDDLLLNPFDESGLNRAYYLLSPVLDNEPTLVPGADDAGWERCQAIFDVDGDGVDDLACTSDRQITVVVLNEDIGDGFKALEPLQYDPGGDGYPDTIVVADALPRDGQNELYVSFTEGDSNLHFVRSEGSWVVGETLGDGDTFYVMAMLADAYDPRGAMLLLEANHGGDNFLTVAEPGGATDREYVPIDPEFDVPSPRLFQEWVENKGLEFTIAGYQQVIEDILVQLNSAVLPPIGHMGGGTATGHVASPMGAVVFSKSGRVLFCTTTSGVLFDNLCAVYRPSAGSYGDWAIVPELGLPSLSARGNHPADAWGILSVEDGSSHEHFSVAYHADPETDDWARGFAEYIFSLIGVVPEPERGTFPVGLYSISSAGMAESGDAAGGFEDANGGAFFNGWIQFREGGSITRVHGLGTFDGADIQVLDIADNGAVLGLELVGAEDDSALHSLVYADLGGGRVRGPFQLGAMQTQWGVGNFVASLDIGIGDPECADVYVAWRNGGVTLERFRCVSAGSRVRIEQGQGDNLGDIWELLDEDRSGLIDLLRLQSEESGE